MIAGEGLGTEVWTPLVRRFSSQGYSGVAVPFPEAVQNSDEGVAFLKDVIEKNGMAPPLLVTHSLASHVAIQYLESHSLAGVIMVNPVPLNPKKAAAMLSTKYTDCSSTEYQTEQEQPGSSVLHRYYGATSGPAASSALLAGEGPGFPKALLRHLSSSPPRVLLEACSVPALVVMTAGDEALFDSKQEFELLNLFGIETGNGQEEEEEVDESGMAATGNDESQSFLRLPYNLSRVAQTSDQTAAKAVAWAEAFV